MFECHGKVRGIRYGLHCPLDDLFLGKRFVGKSLNIERRRGSRAILANALVEAFKPIPAHRGPMMSDGFGHPGDLSLDSTPLAWPERNDQSGEQSQQTPFQGGAGAARKWVVVFRHAQRGRNVDGRIVTEKQPALTSQPTSLISDFEVRMALSTKSYGTLISCPLASFVFVLSTSAHAQTPAPTATDGSQPAEVAEPRPQTVPQSPASQAAPTAEPVGKIHLADQAPPPAPPVARTDKTHDGFYTRLNLGFGSQSASIDLGANFPNVSGSAGALDMGLLIGGAPSPGIVLGGAISLDTMRSTTLDGDSGAQLKTGTMLTSLGPFIDGYPNPRGGFHLGGTVGLSSLSFSNQNDVGTNRAGGFGLAAWLGYDWWVADQWSVGGLLQLSGAHVGRSVQGSSMTADTRSIALLVTAVYQ